jgi:hypothetical protein
MGVSSISGRPSSGPLQAIKRLFSFFWSLISRLLCCGSSSIDWEETSDVFDTLYTLVCPAEHGSYATDRQKKFIQELKRLPEAAKKRLCEHICYVLAERARIKTQSEQARWVEVNREKIDFQKDYFEDIAENEVLQEAVKRFQMEITRKTTGGDHENR